MKWWFVVATVLILFSTQAKAADEVILQLRWLHQFQFAGYYAAKEKGFYQDVGIDATIIAGEPGRIAIEEVLTGRAQYGVANHEVLLNRLRGKPVVALAAIFQHSPAVFMARQDSGIYSPHDLVGRRVMSIGGEADVGLIAMLRAVGIDPAQVEFLKSSFNVSDLIEGNTDLFNAYLTNEPYLMEQKGIPYTILNPTKYGVDFYSDILFTTEREIKKHPDRVERFREASLRGWLYAMEHPEEIIDIILSKYSSKKTREHLRYEANAMRQLILPEKVEMGHINPHRWQIMIDAFKAIGVVGDESKLAGLIYDPAKLLHERQAFTNKVLLIALAAIIIGGSIFWVILLRRTVSIRTRELQESEARTQAILANAVDSIITIDETGSITSFNPASEKLFGYSADEVIGENVKILMPEPYHSEHDRYLANYLQTGERKIIGIGREVVAQRKDGSTFPMELAVGETKLGGHQDFTGIIRDVTEQREYQDALQSLNSELESFAYTVSHDLRGPLRSMSGFSQALIEDCADQLDETGRDYLARISAAAEKMGRLIDDILTLSRLSRGEMRIQSVNLTDLAHDIVSDLRDRDPDREVAVQISANIVAAGDARMLRIVLENLLGNAWKFTEKSQAPTIEFSSIIQEDGKLAYYVRDSGAGFDMKYADKVFTPFERLHTDAEFEGTGIGLATVSRIVARHKGRVWAQSVVGEGTTIYFSLGTGGTSA